MRFKFHTAMIVVALAIGVPALKAGDLPDKDVKALLEEGGTDWSVSQVGFSGFRKSKEPGEVLYLWPASDQITPVRVKTDGTGFKTVKIRWQLRPGAEFPESGSKYLTYQWGAPNGKAYGFQVAKVDKTATSGEFTASLSFSASAIKEKLPADQDVILMVMQRETMGNFIRLKMTFLK